MRIKPYVVWGLRYTWVFNLSFCTLTFAKAVLPGFQPCELCFSFHFFSFFGPASLSRVKVQLGPCQMVLRSRIRLNPREWLLFADDVGVHPMRAELAPSVVDRNLVVLQQYFLFPPSGIWRSCRSSLICGMIHLRLFEHNLASFAPSSRGVSDLVLQASFDDIWSS